MLRCQENNPDTSMTHVACESKLRLVIRSSIHPCQGNCVAFGRTVVYYAGDAHAFSSGIKCRHCGLETAPWQPRQGHAVKWMSRKNVNIEQLNEALIELRNPIYLRGTVLICSGDEIKA